MNPSHTACITCCSNTPTSSDLRSSWVQQHTSSGFKSSFFFWQNSTKPAPGICLGNTHTTLHLIDTKVASRNLTLLFLGL